MAYLMLFLGWAFFYASHTYLASLATKRKIKTLMRSSYPWYRFIYSLLFGAMLLSILIYAGSIPPDYVWQTTTGTTYVGYMLATFGTILGVKAMKGMSISRFIGLRPNDDLVEQEPLNVDGLYRWVRHPLYAGLLLIFLGYFFFLPTFASAVHLAALIAYLPVGIYFEEHKLLHLYGDDYREYQRKVPPFLPTKRP